MQSLVLSQDKSLADLQDLIAENLDKKKSVILVTDVDGTITTGAGLGGGNKETAQKRTRGGQATLDFFKYLDAQGVAWFANSARAQSASTAASVAQTLYKQLGLKSVPFGGECLYVKGKADKYNPPQFWASKHAYKNYVVWTCDNMVSAAADVGALAYDKDIAIDYILEEYVKQRPVTVVFADDFAGNNLRVLDYFSKNPQRGVEIISVHLLPNNPESGQQEALQQLMTKYNTSALVNHKKKSTTRMPPKQQQKNVDDLLRQGINKRRGALREDDDDDGFKDVQVEPTMSVAAGIKQVQKNQAPSSKTKKQTKEKKKDAKDGGDRTALLSAIRKKRRTPVPAVVVPPVPVVAAPPILAVMQEIPPAPLAPEPPVEFASKENKYPTARRKASRKSDKKTSPKKKKSEKKTHKSEKEEKKVVYQPAEMYLSKKGEKNDTATFLAKVNTLVQSGEAKVVAATPVVAKIVDLKTSKEYVVPRGAVAAAPSSVEYLTYQFILGDGYYPEYIARLDKRFEDLEELWKFGLLHPVDYEEWKVDIDTFANKYRDAVFPPDGNPVMFATAPAAVAFQRRWARLIRQYLTRYERFRERVLNSGQYLRNLDSYCRTIKTESCGSTSCAKVQGPCQFKKNRWYPREPSKAAVDYVKKVSGFHVENDCAGGEFQIVKRAGVYKVPDHVFTAAEKPFAAAFLKVYREHYHNILDLVLADLLELGRLGYLARDDFNDEVAALRKLYETVREISSKEVNAVSDVIREQQRMSKAAYPFVHEFRKLREKALHSSTYRKNLARVCKTKQDNPDRCAQEPACMYDTKGTWFSDPRGCIIRPKPNDGGRHTTFKTVDDCD